MKPRLKGSRAWSASNARETRAHCNNSRAEGNKRRRSITHTWNLYSAKSALLAEWEMAENPDPGYIKELRRKVESLRTQLKYKSALL
jgi:hypothetical protein